MLPARPGMKAVTIRVNDAGGFLGVVQPANRVDVLLSRQIDKRQAAKEVLLQNVRVLSFDQSADKTKAAVAKSVTLEVTTVEAQKIWLASSVATLFLRKTKVNPAAH
jgi:pilus assembly protein CpaB